MGNLDDDALELVGRYFAALSVPMRLKILEALRDGRRNVGEIARAARCTQANASKHLSLLARNGLVTKAQQGTAVYYRCAVPAVYELCDRVREHGKHAMPVTLEQRRRRSTLVGCGPELLDRVGGRRR